MFFFCLYYGFLVLVFGLIARFLLEKLKVGSLQEKSVFVTGCDTGFGHLLTLRLLSNGVTVFAGCLTEKGEDELRKESSTLSGRLHAIRLDVTNQESVDNAVQFVKNKLGNGGLWGLVNNAGILGPSIGDDFLSVQDYQKVLDVNTFGVIRTTQAFKPFVKIAKGRIVTVASIVGRVAPAFTGPYTVSKFAVEAYCDCIRLELTPYRVGVSILEPGFFKTGILADAAVMGTFDRLWNNAPKQLQEEYGKEFAAGAKEMIRTNLNLYTSPRVDYVVDAYFHALTAHFPRKRYHVGWDALFFWIPLSFFPTFLQDWVFERLALLTRYPVPKACQDTYP